MHRYFISFPFGLGEYIPNMLENELQNVQVQNVFSTHAVFLTSDSRQTIMNLPFASQIYIYVKQFNHPNVIAPEKQLRWAVVKPTFIEALRGISYKFQKYRIFGQSDSETISLPKALKRNFIEKLEYYEDIRFDNENPEAEIWFVEANKDSKPNGEKVGLCGIKISSHPDYHHTLKKGELRPEIAYFLNFLAEPVKRGTMLDPFAGSGAIPISAAENFNYREIIVGDKDLAGFNENLMKWKSRFNEKIIKVQEFDATQMKTIKDNSIDRIVTDPPWGLYQKDIQIDQFYDEFLKTALKKLKKDGKIVLLVSKHIREAMIETPYFQHFQLVESITLPIWGQPAAALKINSAKIKRPKKSRFDNVK